MKTLYVLTHEDGLTGEETLRVFDTPLSAYRAASSVIRERVEALHPMRRSGQFGLGAVPLYEDDRAAILRGIEAAQLGQYDFITTMGAAVDLFNQLDEDERLYVDPAAYYPD